MSCQETNDFKASLLRETSQSSGATHALVPGKLANSFILGEIVKTTLTGERGRNCQRTCSSIVRPII